MYPSLTMFLPYARMHKTQLEAETTMVVMMSVNFVSWVDVQLNFLQLDRLRISTKRVHR